MRARVCVRLHLRWCEHQIDLEGEAVHVVPPEMADMGGRAGVAVQFDGAPAEIRAQLEPYCAAPAEPTLPPPENEERIAPRKLVRVNATIDGPDGRVDGRTRNLSRNGVLIGFEAGAVALQSAVTVGMEHPATRERLEIAGVVVRAVEHGGRVNAVAVHFDTDAPNRDEIEGFIESVQSVEHTRRLGGITGPIAELGPQALVQMFANTAPQGTILLRSGEDEGVVCFEGGLMVSADTGGTSGMKALVRMLSWREGTFEFHTGVEDRGEGAAPFPLEAAIFDAVRQLDEGERAEPGSFPLQARLTAAPGADLGAAGDLSKLEQALLDLAAAGFSLQRALEVIPEPDPEIFTALRQLIDAELLELR
ncbi:MAG: DUF4388 domain-containing protein [Myxococcota bacterium]